MVGNGCALTSRCLCSSPVLTWQMLRTPETHWSHCHGAQTVASELSSGATAPLAPYWPGQPGHHLTNQKWVLQIITNQNSPVIPGTDEVELMVLLPLDSGLGGGLVSWCSAPLTDGLSGCHPGLVSCGGWYCGYCGSVTKVGSVVGLVEPKVGSVVQWNQRWVVWFDGTKGG